MTDWRALAGCAGRVADMQALQVSPARVRAAKVICRRCPVLDACRAWVLSVDPDPCPWHVVAAMTPKERWHVYAYGRPA